MQKNSPLALVFHALFISFILAPLVVVVAVAFTDKGFISFPTDGLSLRWFRAILDATEIKSAFWFSAKLGLASASIAIALAVPAALAITRYRFAGREVLMAFFMSPLMIPHVVLGAAFLRFFNIAGLSGSFFWLMFTHVICIMPYALRMVLAAATVIVSSSKLWMKDSIQPPAIPAISMGTVMRRKTVLRDAGVCGHPRHDDLAGRHVQPHRPDHRPAGDIGLHRADRRHPGADGHPGQAGRPGEGSDWQRLRAKNEQQHT